MTDKTFSIAGVSTLKGECKIRFANDMMRVKVLAKGGHYDIDLMPLIEPMTRDDAAAYLLRINFDNGNAVVRAALEAYASEDKPKAAPKAAPSIEAIRARAPKNPVTAAADAPELEDAPF